MPTMNLTDLKKAVADATQMNLTDAEKVIKVVTTSIEDALKAGDSVVLVGFGTFSVALRIPSLARFDCQNIC